MNKIINKNVGWLLIALLFTVNGQLFAQKKRHNIQISSIGYTFVNDGFYLDFPTKQYGIRYRYRFYKNFALYAKFQTNVPPPYHSVPGDENFYCFIIELQQGNVRGKTYPYFTFRLNYFFFDLGASYCYPINPKNKLSAHLALSKCYGTNSYSSFYNLDLGGAQKVNYWGAVAGLSYDYYFWKERINAGATINFRYYEKDMPSFMDYGLQLGYNF